MLVVDEVSVRHAHTEFAQGELFEILEDDQSLPEDVVQVRVTPGPRLVPWG